MPAAFVSLRLSAMVAYVKLHAVVNSNTRSPFWLGQSESDRIKLRCLSDSDRLEMWITRGHMAGVLKLIQLVTRSVFVSKEDTTTL